MLMQKYQASSTGRESVIFIYQPFD